MDFFIFRYMRSLILIILIVSTIGCSKDIQTDYSTNNNFQLVTDIETANPLIHQYIKKLTLGGLNNKFGTSALKLSGICPVKLPAYNLQSTEWSMRAWMAMATAHHASTTKPLLFDITPIAGDSIQVELDGDSTSGNYGKVVLYVNSVEVATSTANTYWTNFGSAAWVHVTFQKREESLGLYQYEVFFNGNLVVNYQSTSDVSIELGAEEKLY